MFPHAQPCPLHPLIGLIGQVAILPKTTQDVEAKALQAHLLAKVVYAFTDE